MASELTAARQEMRKTNCKLEVVQHQMGDLQKQFTGMQDQLSRMETRLQRFVNSLRRTTEPAVGRGAPNLRPPGDPTDLLDRVQLAELEMEMTRRLEDLRQIVATGWEQDQLPNVSTPEGNFSFPSTGFSVVATGWDQDPSPHSSLASPTWNHQKPNQQVNFNPSNDMAPSFFKSLAKGPIIDSPEIVGGEPLVEAVAKKMESTMKSFTQGVCKYCGYKWVLGHRCKQNQQVNLMVGNFSAEAQFDLAKLYMGKRVDKFILARSTGLRWNLPPWPGFCAMVSDCFAQPEDLALKVESAFYFVGALIISDSPATVMSSLLVVQKDLPIQHILPRRRIVVSRQGNHKVPVDVIYLTLRISQDDFPQYEEFKHNLIEVVTPEKLERDKGEPPPQSGLHKPSGLKLVAAHMRSNIELGSEPYDINEKYAILRALLMVLLNMVGRDGRVFRSMGLLWNLPPWPDLNDIKHYLKLLNPQSFCEVYSRAKDIEKGAAAICLRLVTSVPYLKGDTPSMLDEIVPKITEGFIASRIKSVQASFADNSSDNPLDNVEVLQEQLESLPYIGRFQYQSSSLYIINIMVPLLQAYTERSRLPAPGDADVLSVIEGQIAGMVHIIAAILKSRQTIGCSQESQELIDAELSARVLQLVNITDTGVHAQRYQELSKQRLDRAILIFVQNFRRSYVGDQAMHSAKLFARLYELLGLNDHLVLLNVIVGKIVTNLKCYAECEDVIDHTLSFFLELTSGYMTGKLLLKLESTKFIIANHSWENFPFLEEYRCFRSRTTFYYILGFLVFTEDGPVKFRSFMEPLLQVAVNREATADAASSVVKYAFIGLMKDLRDIAIAIYSRRTYGLLFDWMYPSRMPLLLRAILLWADEPEVTTPLLKFMYEFVLNKAQRLTFDPSSPNGILLFREISKLIVAYGSRILLLPNGTDIYGSKYKGIWISLTNLSRALCGNYVNFGVFELYGDRVLADALDISLKVTLSVPLSDIMAFCIESCSANWRVHSLFGPPSPVCSQFVWHIDRLNLVQLFGEFPV